MLNDLHLSRIAQLFAISIKNCKNILFIAFIDFWLQSYIIYYYAPLNYVSNIINIVSTTANKGKIVSFRPTEEMKFSQLRKLNSAN